MLDGVGTSAGTFATECTQVAASTGVAAVRVTDTLPNPRDHRASDTADTPDDDWLATVTDATAHLVGRVVDDTSPDAAATAAGLSS